MENKKRIKVADLLESAEQDHTYYYRYVKDSKVVNKSRNLINNSYNSGAGEVLVLNYLIFKFKETVYL